MPRPLRIEFENAWYHVMNRGANQQTIFESDFHRNLFFELLEEIVARFNIEIHAYCLMNNHYHLLIKTPNANLGRAMKHLDALYTQRFNRATHRDGPLFRGRYKAILVDSDQYLLQVSRYIHLNPVAAKLCKKPIDYKWSSYRFFISKQSLFAWLTTSFTLNQFSGFNKTSSYASFVNEGLDKETAKFYQKKHLPSIYGGKLFIDKHLKNLDYAYAQHVLPDIRHTKPLPKKNEILNAVMNYFNISQEELQESMQGKRNTPKLISIYLLSQLAQLKHKSISKIFPSLQEGSIPTQIKRLKNKMALDDEISKHIANITIAIEKISYS